MEEVRLANTEYREGKIAEALERLRRDGRIIEAETPDEAYDLLVCAWYAERTRRLNDPNRKRSAMTTEHHIERKELNTRARLLLAADGTLMGHELRIGDCAFRVGDEVVARLTDRSLRAEGADRSSYVRNGSFGRVRAVRDDGLSVAFERWGVVDVPREYIERRLSAGLIGGLQHAYAITTHLAQGETHALAAPLVSDGSSSAGVYVGITRGQFDLRSVMVRRSPGPSLQELSHLRITSVDVSTIAVLQAKLINDELPTLAIEHEQPKATTKALKP